jgi:hypothetical protein
MRENGGGGVRRKKNGGLSTADQMKDRQKRLKQMLSQIKKPYKTYVIKKVVRPTLS